MRSLQALALAQASLALADAVPPPAPVLDIDRAAISVSGVSSGADFAVAFSTAHSANIMGVGVFAGQPYHCAVTRFPKDQTYSCALTPPGRHYPVGPAGCYPGTPSEPPSQSGEGLLWDHCKGCSALSLLQLTEHPDLVQMDTLFDYAKETAAKGLIDGTGNLSSTRAFVYRGTKDECYTHNVMEKTTSWFRTFSSDPAELVKFVDTIPSQHAMPTLVSGTPCGKKPSFEEKYAPGVLSDLEACGFDGPGECLKHIYGQDLTPPPAADAIDWSRIFEFDQLPFGMLGDDSKAMAFARTGYMYVPKQCERSSTNNTKPCRLHVYFHGCGSAFTSGQQKAPGFGFNYTSIAYSGYSAWAELNNVVVVYPQKNATQETCWDGYGWGGPLYATQRGGQIAAVWNLIRHVAGF